MPSKKTPARVQQLRAPTATQEAVDHVTQSIDATSPDAVRESLQGLYNLATTLLHPEPSESTGYQYFAKRLEVEQSRRITSEQIWGQMTVLLAPIMTRVRERLDRPTTRASQNDLKKVPKPGGKSVALAEDEVDANHDADEALEKELDGEIAAMLQAQSAKKRKAVGGGVDRSDVDEWRYALGKGEESDDDDEEEDGGEDDEEDEGDDEEDLDMMEELPSDDDANGNQATTSRVKDRNALAMLDAEAEGEEDEELDDDEEGDEAEDSEDDRAALKELYGDDFSDDDAQLGEFGDEEDEGDEEEEGEEAEEKTFNEEDGKYWGDDDILDDPEGQFGGKGSSSGVEDEGLENDAELVDPHLTKFEREKLREKKAVETLEEQRLYAGNWAMGGEVTGTKRPHDSLLEEALEFEHAMRPVPVVTEAVTARLEDRIRKRIADKNFDDVKRRVTRTNADDLVTTRRDAALESEKSKMSLMDLYEKDFLAKQQRAEEASGTAEAATAEPLTEIEKDELRAVQMWKRLSQHLDALSNFYFTPKPVKQDLEARVRAVDHQAPAIAMESVGNLAVAREAALAPQDLYRPAANTKFRGVSVEEMDPAEKRALRRAKKESFQHTKERKEKQVALRTAAKEEAKKKSDAAKDAAAAFKGKRGRK